ncbi:MAG: GumC family protein [Roseobacter sp.]
MTDSPEQRSEMDYSLMEEPASSEHFFDFGKLFQQIRRDMWLVIAIVAFGASVAFYYAYFMATPMYRAAASVIMDTANTDAADLPGERIGGQMNETELNTQITILLSEGLLRRVIDRLDLLNDPEFNPFTDIDRSELTDEQRAALDTSLSTVVANNLRRVVSARNIQRTFVVLTAATTSSPVKSQQIANAMVDTYLQLQVEQKRDAARTATQWLNQRVIELQNDVIEAEQRIDDFGTGALAETTGQGMTLRSLTEQAQAVNEQYQYFLNRLTEASAQEGIYQPDGRVLSYASAPLRPIAPRKRLILFAGIMISGALAMGLVLSRGFLSNKIRARKTLEAATAVPIVGVISKTSFASKTSGKTELLQGNSDEFQMSINELMGNLQLSFHGQTGTIQVLASCNAGEGKTTTVQALARAHARAGRSVLLIDADLRKRTLTKSLSPNLKKGLVALSDGEVTLEDAVAQTDTEKVYFLGCEASTKQPVDILHSKQFHDALEAARNQADVVLIDTAPIMSSADLMAFGHKCNVVVLLARESYTSIGAIKLAIGKLRRQNIKPSGIAVTMVGKRALPAWQNPFY